MNKDEVMGAIRNYRDLAVRMSGELEKIDSGLKDEIREKREAQVKEKYEKHLTANIEKIKAGREHFTRTRLKAADPFRALMLKTFKSDVSAGLAAVCEGLSLMDPEAQLDFVQEIGHPALVLKAITNIRRMDLDPEARMSLTSRVRELSKQYVDQKEIRDYAEVEKACLECEAYENQITEGSLHDRAAIGYRLSALERVMKTGEVPDEELVDALAQADPQDRLKAGHAAA